MLIFFCAIFSMSLILTFLVRQIALKNNIIDNPNERSSHKTPTPRGGGLAIAITWFGGLGYLFLSDQIPQNLFFALLSGIILAIVSLIDDIYNLKPIIRIIAQALSAAGALFFLDGFNMSFIQNQYLFYLVNFGVFIGIIWFINLFNFLDGIDAYASQEAILVSLGVFFVTGFPVMGLLIAAVLGFLFWNWPKAKIFMGDVGSTQLGFILIVIGIYHHNLQELSIVEWLILTAIFWFDATITLLRRWKNKEKLSVAHKKHAYQRLVQKGFSHLKVNIYAIGLNFLLVGIVLTNHFILQKSMFSLSVVVILLYFVYLRIEKLYPFHNV